MPNVFFIQRVRQEVVVGEKKKKLIYIYILAAAGSESIPLARDEFKIELQSFIK